MYFFRPDALLQELLEADASKHLRIGRSYDPATREEPIAKEARPGEKAGNPLLDDYTRLPEKPPLTPDP